MNRILHRIGLFFNESDTPKSIWSGVNEYLYAADLANLDTDDVGDGAADKLSMRATSGFQRSTDIRRDQRIVIAGDDIRMVHAKMSSAAIERLEELELVEIVLQDNKQKGITIKQSSGYFMGIYRGIVAAKINDSDYRLYLRLSDDAQDSPVTLYFNLANIGYLNTHQSIAEFAKGKRTKGGINVFGQSVLSLRP